MTVGVIMMQQRPHDDAHTSLHLKGGVGAGVCAWLLRFVFGVLMMSETNTQTHTDTQTHLHRSGAASTPRVMNKGTGGDSDDDAPTATIYVLALAQRTYTWVVLQGPAALLM